MIDTSAEMGIVAPDRMIRSNLLLVGEEVAFGWTLRAGTSL